MGQTLTSSSLVAGGESPSLSSPSTPEPQLASTHDVIGQDLRNNGDEEFLTPTSISSTSKQPLTEDAARGASRSTRAPLMMEAFIKTLEQLAVQQWPTWAKRRGWITDCDEPVSSNALLSETSEISEPVFEGAHHTWTFGQRLRPNSIERGTHFYTEAAFDSGLLDGASKEVLGECDQIESATSSKLVVKDEVYVPISEKEATLNLADLYEMTLRWIFEPDEASHGQDVAVISQQVERGLCSCEDYSARKLETNTQALSNIRIYVRILRKTGTEISVIDFRPISEPSTSLEQKYALPDYESKHDFYFVDISKNESTTILSFPRNVSASDLISEMVRVHPMLEGFKTEQLAIYEKCWFPGKTSRARLRRINDLEHPLLLASELKQNNRPHGDASSPIPMTRAMVLQECQTSDISWGEFSITELNNFLKVLEREEASHEFFIRQKYEHWAQVLNMAIQTANKKP